jgi:arginine N-succinyltransferase
VTFRIRAARDTDLQPLYEMAKLTGGGFTNLPADRTALKAKLDRSSASFAREEDTLDDEVFVLVLENAAPASSSPGSGKNIPSTATASVR